MTVAELMALLEDCDPDAQVILMTQRQWPWENALVGVAVRAEAEELDADGDHEATTDRESRRETGTSGSDVFLLEGEQLRYGSAAAWRARRR